MSQHAQSDLCFLVAWGRWLGKTAAEMILGDYERKEGLYEEGEEVCMPFIWPALQQIRDLDDLKVVGQYNSHLFCHLLFCLLAEIFGLRLYAEHLHWILGIRERVIGCWHLFIYMVKRGTECLGAVQCGDGT